MGDAADYEFETGMDGYIAHLNGECDEFCPYCDDENGEDGELRKLQFEEPH